MEKLFENSLMKLLEILKKPLVRVALLIAVMAVLSGAGWAVYQTQITPEQPIQFPHNIHVNLGIPCLYCHPGAWRQASAGLPTVQKCWACHDQLAIYAKRPVSTWPVQLQKLASYVVQDQSGVTFKPIKWVPVYQVPDFVHFNHRPHMAAGLNCENCHGDMSTKTVETVEQTVNMGWCLNCHRAKTENNAQNNPNSDPQVAALLAEKRTKLLDCSTCHY
jgi:hypothetical protein